MDVKEFELKLEVVKITKKNDQAWLTCHLDGKYVAILHVVDKKLADKIHQPKSITLDTMTIADTPGVVFASKPKPADQKELSLKEQRFKEFDQTLGRSTHSTPLPNTRPKDKFTDWSGHPYQHKP